MELLRSSSSGGSASQGPRSTISICAPWYMFGGRGSRQLDLTSGDRRVESDEKGARLARAVAPERPQARDELISLGVTGGDRERRRLGDCQRRGTVRQRRRIERDDGAVGVTAKMVARPHPLGDPGRVLLEVDPIGRRPGRKARTVEDYELELVRQRPLLDPSRVTVADTAVNEDDSLHLKVPLRPSVVCACPT